MKKFNLPTRKECLAIIEEHRVPLHIVKHSLAVAKLAVFLAQKLNEKGVVVDVNLVNSACLLHDILRVCDFEESDYSRFEQPVTGKDKATWQRLKAKYRELCHEEATYELLKERYPVLALTIRKHRYTAILDEEQRPKTWEEKLLYYADKRVMHDKIVPLKNRLEEAHRRNICQRGTTAQSKVNTTEVDLLIFRLEEEVFDKIGLNPVEITSEFIDWHSKSTFDNILNQQDTA